MLTFLILGITVIWCHSFTKLTGVGRKCTAAGSLSKLFSLRLPFYILFYSSYILCSQLRMTRQMTSSTTSSIALEEARPMAILGTTLEEEARPMAILGTTLEEEARLALILGTTKCRCLYVFTLDLWSCLWMLCCVCMWWILWSLDECVGYCDLWMNVLNIVIFEWVCWIWMSIWMYYIFCVQCAGFVISVVLVIVYSARKIIAQAYLLLLERP
jgi:hypothetical protein